MPINYETELDELFYFIRLLADKCDKYSYNTDTCKLHRDGCGDLIYVEDLHELINKEKETIISLARASKRLKYFLSIKNIPR